MAIITLKWPLISCALSALREIEQRKEITLYFADLVKLIIEYFGYGLKAKKKIFLLPTK